MKGGIVRDDHIPMWLRKVMKSSQPHTLTVPGLGRRHKTSFHFFILLYIYF